MSSAPHSPLRLVELLAAVFAYAVAAVLLLHPVFARVGSEVYSPSMALARPMAAWVMWILAWDVHALGDSALRLFDANVFHPAGDALAYADPLLGALPFFAPVYLLTGNPIAGYQFTLLATLALCGASMYALVRHWGLGVAPAALAGLVYAFCPARLAAMAEFLYVSGQYLPLALIFADRLMTDRPRWLDALLLFAFAAWQMLCGAQLAYASLIVLGIYVVAGAVLRSDRGRSWTGIVLAAAAVAGAAAVLVLVTAPTRALVESGMFTGRAMQDFAVFGSADAWRNYLVPPYLSRLGVNTSGAALYPGLVVLALALIGVFGWTRARLPLLAVVAACYWLSLGPQLAGGTLSAYRWALAGLPGFALHGPEPSRFALVGMVAVAGLAAFGTAGLHQRARRRGAWFGRLAAVALCFAVLADYRLPFQRFETQRVRFGRADMPLDATLAELPAGPVLELPMDPCALREAGAAIERQLASTLHWNPLLDGYRRYDRAPATYALVRALAGALPDARALRLLRRATGLRYVVVHLTELPGEWRHRWRSVEGLTRIGFFGHDLLFEVTLDETDDLREDLLALPRSSRTLTGIAAEALPTADRAGRFQFISLPTRSTLAGNRMRVEVLVENRSAAAWPALTTDAAHKVHLSYLWTDAAGELAGGDAQAQALPFDLGPGESAAMPVCVEVPNKAGELELAFGLTQNDQWFPDFSEKIRIRVSR